MDKEIINLIYEYAKEYEIIDDFFVRQIFMIAKEHYRLDDYIKRINILYNITPNMHACYAFRTKEFFVFIDNIYREINALKKEFKCINGTEMFEYFYCAQILLHEIEHAHQHKKITVFNDLESEILKAEFSPDYKTIKKSFLLRTIDSVKQNIKKEKYYLFSPSERLAEIYSSETAQKLSLSMEDEISNNVIEFFKLNTLLKGYNTGSIKYLSNAPTKTYLEKMNPKYDYSIIENLGNDINQTDKMGFGLETTQEELNKVAQKRLTLYEKLTNKK